MASLLEIENLKKHYRMGESVVRALDGVSMSVEAGEFVALLGTSGSGKSTLLNLIAGLDRPTAGALRVFGDDLAQRLCQVVRATAELNRLAATFC